MAILATLAAIHLLLAATAEQGRTGDPSRFPDIDEAVVVGDVWQWRHGVVAMRDFGSELGPLAQALAAAASAGFDGAQLVDAFPAVRLGFRVLTAVGLVTLLALAPLSNPGLALLGGASLYIGWTARWTSYRALLALLVAVLAARAVFGDSAQRRSSRLATAAAAAAAWLAVELLSPDFALYLLAAIAVAPLLWAAARGFPDAPGAGAAAGRTLALVASWLGANALLAVLFRLSSREPRPLLEPFRRTTRMIATYAETVGRPWGLDPVRSGLLAVAAAGAAGLALVALRRARPSHAGTLALFVPLALFALRGGMVRSDVRHIALAVTPLVLTLGWSSPAVAGLPTRRRWLVWGAVLALWLVAWPLPLGAHTVRRLLDGRSSGPVAAVGEALRFDNGGETLPELAGVAPDLPAVLYAYPYDNRIGPMLGRELATPIHQAHAAHTLDLQRDVVAELERRGDRVAVVLALDRAGAWPFDGAQTPTRSPVLFRYLLERFERDPARVLDGGSIVLRRTQAPRVAETRSLEFRASRDGRVEQLDLAEPAACPLLRLRLRIGYPWTRRMGWPAPVAVEAGGPAGPVARSRIPRLDGTASFETYLAVSPPPELARLFDSGAHPAAPVVTRLRLAPETGGWIGVAADRVEVERVDCIAGMRAPSADGRGGAS